MADFVNRIFAIDPSLRRMGWAYFTREYKLGPKGAGDIVWSPWILKDKGLLKGRPRTRAEKKDWTGRVTALVRGAVDTCDECGGASVVVIELPSVYNAGKGAVASGSGAIMKLAFMVGMLGGLMVRLPAVRSGVRFVPVRKWKGTVPKEITQRRVQRRWGVTIGDDGVDHNVIDAIGIGSWYISQLNGDTPKA